jgi:hypothetical protein
VQQGDVLGLLESQQLHKLEADPADRGTPQPFIVIWTDELTMKKLEAFYTVREDSPGKGCF